jgi:hypothetical protein
VKPEWITAVATLVYAGFTLWIIIETRRDRKLLHKPYLEATLKNAKYPDWLLFNVKNVGKGPALNCKYICIDNGEMEWKTKEAVLPIGSDETVEIKFDVVERFGKKLGTLIWLEIEFIDVFNKSKKQKIYEGSQQYVVNTFGVSD